MYRKQLKCLKWQKIALVGLMTIITLLTTLLPTFATSAGNVGDNYPTIPMYLELRYPDKAVFMNITDRYHYENTVNHDEVIVSGRHIVTDLITRSIQAEGVLLRKAISSDYTLAPIGFEISSPTFYLNRKEGVDGFIQTVPYIKIPSTINLEGVLTYDVYMGGNTKIGSVERTFASPLGSETNLNLYTFNEINQLRADIDWDSCRIENLKFTTTTLSYPESVAGDSNVLYGTWLLDEDIVPQATSNSDSYVTMNIPFVSNGTNFTGMVFGDTVELLYLNTVGQTERIMVWSNTLGWVNEEYRTIYFSDKYTWDDVVKSDSSGMYFAGAEFRQWMQTYATKKTAQGGYDGGYILHWRYQVQTNEYINAYLNAYETEYASAGGDTSEIYYKGYEAGETVGFNKGFTQGYQKAVGETNPDLTSWLSVATGGILAFEILPNITLLDILGILVTIALVIALLKFFAGG